MMERARIIDNIQSSEYSFPYHYLPSRSGFPRFARSWNFSPSYLSAIGLFASWLSYHKSECGTSHRHIDIGCGDGGFLNSVAGTGNFLDVSFTGIDYDPRAIFWAKAFAMEGCAFECQPLADLNCSKYDSASLVEVVEHIPPSELPNFIAEVASVLKHDAPLFVTVPSIEKSVEAKHYQHFDFEGIMNVFRDHFDIIEIKGFERFGFLGKAIRKLTQGKRHYLEFAPVSDYLIATCQATHDTLQGCGRIYLSVRRKSSAVHKG